MVLQYKIKKLKKLNKKKKWTVCPQLGQHRLSLEDFILFRAVHRKIDSKVQRVPIYPLCPAQHGFFFNQTWEVRQTESEDPLTGANEETQPEDPELVLPCRAEQRSSRDQRPQGLLWEQKHTLCKLPKWCQSQLGSSLLKALGNYVGNPPHPRLNSTQPLGFVSCLELSVILSAFFFNPSLTVYLII